MKLAKVVRVIDSHPDTETLDDVIFLVGETFTARATTVYAGNVWI
jgi:hypothetical protein